MTDLPESANDGDGPLFRPEDFEQWLGETPKPLVIDVEPLRMCSEFHIYGTKWKNPPSPSSQPSPPWNIPLVDFSNDHH